MFNPDFDPYEVLKQLQITTMSQDQEITELKNQLQAHAHLLEAVATQTKHLTNAIIGLQNQNKLLHQRLELLENFNND